MKYIINVPDGHTDLKVFYTDADMKIIQTMRYEPYTELDRNAIEDEVWELADYMCRMGVYEKEKCFGFSSTTEVTTNLSYQEAKAKFEAWLKQEDEIRVGDEVYSVNSKATRVVTKIKNRFAYQMGYDGNVWADDISDLHKTGRHFPEVAELLEKMRGEEE